TGVGVGLRPRHHSVFLNQAPESVSWVEVVSENFMPWRGRSLGASFFTLEKIRKTYPVSLHGVSLNIGSVDDLDLEYLARLKVLVDSIEPFVVSDHLSWTGVHSQNLHDLIPVPYNFETLELLEKKIQQTQEFLKRPLAFENPSSYVEFKGSEMTEPEFIKELVKRTGCKLLLDINNVYVSSQNHGFSATAYLEQIPAKNVVQIHLAGHSVVDNFRIDTHDTDVCDEVWHLYRWFTEKFGHFKTMIERDGNIPAWAELEQELIKLKNIRATL
ncbi:MAG: DUF692 domain-containing protein, partial [Bdellovibrionales bacterium]|nr:DUF692 domain-containing protein [Bdellovibrionales bacterium]